MSLSRLAPWLAGLLGFSGVLLAALGSHAVPGMDDPANYRAWQAASLVHLAHAPVLLLIARSAPGHDSALGVVAALLLVAGVALFSGSIYARVWLGLPGTFHLAPTGGLLLMACWLLLPFTLRHS